MEKKIEIDKKTVITAAGVDNHSQPDVPNEGSAQTAPISPIEQREQGEVSAPTTTIADSPDTRTTTDTDPTRRTVKQRKSELDEYKRRYMQTPRIEDRKPVFVSRRTRDRLDRIVRLLGERGMSVSGLIENIARRHLDAHEPDVEHWRRL